MQPLKALVPGTQAVPGEKQTGPHGPELIWMGLGQVWGGRREGKDNPTANYVNGRLLACGVELSYGCYLQGFALQEGTSKS